MELLLRRYWRSLGRWLRLSQPGRALFTAAFLFGVAEIVFVHAQAAGRVAHPALSWRSCWQAWLLSMPWDRESSLLYAAALERWAQASSEHWRSERALTLG